MPVIKSAIKKLRQDKKRETANKRLKNLLKKSVKKASKNPSNALVRTAVSMADKASRKNIIAKNKAARIKSHLTKLIKPNIKKASSVKSVKGSVRKSPRSAR